MELRRKVLSSNSKNETFLQNVLNSSIIPSTSPNSYPYQRYQKITANTPESFNIEPISVIVDRNRNKKHSARKRLIFPYPPNIPSYAKLNSKNPEIYGNMTQSGIKTSEATNPSKIICNIAKNLHASAVAFLKETNKENITELKAITPINHSKKCSSLGKIVTPLTDLPPLLIDNILDMKEEYKIKQEKVILPDDLVSVSVDSNLFSNY